MRSVIGLMVHQCRFMGGARVLAATAAICIAGLPAPLWGQWACTSVLCTTAGNVGIGTTTATTPLQLGTWFLPLHWNPASPPLPTKLLINDQPTTMSRQEQATLLVSLQPNPSGNSPAQYYGLFEQTSVPSSSTVTYSELGGGIVRDIYWGSGNVSDMYGLMVSAFNDGTASVSTIAGMLAQAGIGSNNPTATVTNSYALSAYSYNSSTNGTIANEYGLYSQADNSGTVTNGYGLYITGFATGGTHTNTPFDIYAADTGAYNYLAGNVGIGTTNPQYPLAVNGTIQAKVRQAITSIQIAPTTR